MTTTANLNLYNNSTRDHFLKLHADATSAVISSDVKIVLKSNTLELRDQTGSRLYSDVASTLLSL